MTWEWLDQRPLIVAIAGPNGAGKTTFFHAHVAPSSLRFVNTDVLAGHLEMDAYLAATVAGSLRAELVRQRESFAFETVFSDPVGDKLTFMKQAVADGYQVLLCYIGLASAEMSEARVAMRVAQGGHDVPSEKIFSRFPRTMANLKSAVLDLPHVMVFDNSNLASPYRRIAVFERGLLIERVQPFPRWFRELVS